MADVIREVLIRGKMEIIKADLAVPDITAFTKQLEAQNKLAQEQAAFLGQLIDQQQKREQQAKADDEANKQRAAENARIREEQRKAAEQARKEREEAKRQAAELAAAEKAAAEAAAAAEEQRRKEIEETNRAREEAIRKEREINDSLLKGGDALKQVGDGAFAFARGLTLIGLEGDANLEKVARAVASVQAKFDLFRGSVDLIKGGVESARAFATAIELAGGATALFTSRMAALVAFLGPTGLIVAGTAAVTAALLYLFSEAEDSAADFIANSEEKLNRFVSEAERAAAEAQAAFDRQDAIRETLTGQGKIDAIQGELSGLKAGPSIEEINRREAERFAKLFDGTERTTEEVDAERARINAVTMADFDAAEQEKQRRRQLTRELLSATTERDGGANRERETAIREAQRAEEEKRREVQRVQEELKRAEEQRAEQARRQAAERAGFSASDRAFVDRASQNIQGLSAKELERLGSTARENFGQDVTDELVRRGGGTPAERRDEVAELKNELAALTEALKERSAATSGLRAADATADAEAEAGAEALRKLLRDLAGDIEKIQVERARTESYFREGNG